jgi:hypothetical protein
MKTNRLVLVGVVGAGLAGCDVRCLGSGAPPALKPTAAEGKANVRLVGEQTGDTGKVGEPPPAFVPESTKTPPPGSK